LNEVWYRLFTKVNYVEFK